MQEAVVHQAAHKGGAGHSFVGCWHKGHMLSWAAGLNGRGRLQPNNLFFMVSSTIMIYSLSFLF
jgi:hypothetical protein